jgi:hypothetical protein
VPSSTAHVQTTLPTRAVRPTRRALTLPAPRDLLALAGGVGALLLAAAGEALVESHNTTPVSLLLYLVAIALFAASAWLVPPAPVDLPVLGPVAPATAGRQRRTWAIAGGGVGLAILLDLGALSLLHEDIRSIAGAWLWVASLLVLGVTGVVLHRRWGWLPRWGEAAGPATARGRWVAPAILVAVLALAAAARLLGLDKVPLGINADEGDRAATAIQIMRGDNTESIFDYGWYFISMLYFWLLAGVLKILGAGYVQARVFGALAGLLATGIVSWIGIRHFGWRVGLLAGGLLAVLAVALQFSRETSESGVTAMLWALSVACFLEAARTGRAWAWIGAGFAGGFSLYFYPTGRLWAVLAAAYCLYLLAHGLGGRRPAVLRGVALAALATLLIASPFLLNGIAHPDTITLRAQETSIFTANNPTRLSYYKPEWTTAQLLVEQTIRSVGIFNQFHDDGGFWPTDEPIMSGLLAVLTLLGLGWVCVRPRDPRFVALAIWFWVGFAGVIVTVETPNVQRMGAAVPVLALFPALVLDSLARRLELGLRRVDLRTAPVLRWAPTALAALLMLVLMWGQARFYFADYGKVDRWPQPTIQGRAVADQGADTLVVTLGRQYHMVNSGWVRLLAPNTPRGGVQAPGSTLPLAVAADHNLAFEVYPRQMEYLPFLQEMYPGGVTEPYTHPTESLVVTIYRVSQQQWAATQGALAHPQSASPQQVPGLGVAPSGWTQYPAAMRWTAGWQVPAYWNYAVRIGPGPAKLTIDGQHVLTVPAGTPVLTTTVMLARGEHAVAYDGTLTAPDQAALFEWAALPADAPDAEAPLDWSVPATETLRATQDAPQGLLGTIQVGDRPAQLRIDQALADCCLSDHLRADGQPYTATWSGTLTAPTTGVYSMTLFAQGTVDLQVDGQSVIRRDGPSDEPIGGSATLNAGPHAVKLVYRVESGGGGLEWAWTPPGGQRSIVPPSALAPPPGAGVGPAAPPEALGKREYQPVLPPLDVVP